MPPAGNASSEATRRGHRADPRILVPLVSAVVVIAVGWSLWQKNRASNAGPAGSGTVEVVEVEVASQVPGRISELLVDEGDRVTRGQLIARLDDREYRSSVAQAEGVRETALNNLRNLQEGARPQQIAAARAQLEAAAAAHAGATQALANAELAFRKVADLTQNVIGARAQVRSLTAQLTAAKQAAAAAQAQSAGAKDTLATAETGLSSVTELRQAVDAAEGQRDATRAARVRAESALTTAQADYRRVLNLNEEGAVSRRDLDNAKLALDTAQAALESAQAQAVAAEAGLRNANQALKQRLTATQSAISARTASRMTARQLEAARATVRQVSAQLDGARRAQANAESAYADRVQARTQRDAAQAQVRTTRAQVEAARQSLRLLEAGATVANIRAARGQLLSAEAALALSRKRQSDTKVYAPYNGVIGTVVARSGETVSSGLPIVRMLDLDYAWVRVYLPFTSFGKVRRGDAVQVTTDALPRETFHGKVSQVASEAEFTPKNVETRDQRLQQVYWVKVAIDNPDGRLKPGMPVRATWTGGGAGQ